MSTTPAPARPLAEGKLAVRKDPRHRNPNGWAVVSNEPVPHWIGRRRVRGEEHAGLYAYPFKSWHSAVLRAQREAIRRDQLKRIKVVRKDNVFFLGTGA
jgi:hypothetical protein